MKHLAILPLLAAALLLPMNARAAADAAATDSITVININPLFTYPTAPDDIPDLKGRTNWIMKNFWNPMDFKSKKTVDQTALNDAFNVYASSMPYADRETVLASVDELLKKLKKNPVLLYQFTKSAEESLYGPRANMWIDEVYVRFLRELAKAKKISAPRKARYTDQLRRLENSMSGSPMPEIVITQRDGTAATYRPTPGRVALIEFGFPDCEDCRKSRLYLEVDIKFNELLRDGKAEMAFIIPDEDENGELLDMTERYPKEWTVGKSPSAAEDIDIRDTPSFFVIGRDGAIAAKNVTLNEALNLITKLSNVTD